ncbi:ATP-binding cassette domain-containing protein [Streptomyces sp. NPDC048430]|uniref:ATP-binding cassette domain-containing protein n=1 Tax=Streptomyces sp. NPDC048430 TaxID=3155388 RepID=UPI00341574F4
MALPGCSTRPSATAAARRCCAAPRCSPRRVRCSRPSGSRKTTALRAVAGFEPLRSGSVLVSGRNVTAVPTPQRALAMVFQATTLVPFLDVAENMAMAMRACGTVDADEAARRIDDRGRRLRLGRLLTRMPRTLSPGAVQAERGEVQPGPDDVGGDVERYGTG